MVLKDVKVNGHKLIPPRVTLHKNNISEVQKALLRKKETQLLFLEVTVGSSIQLRTMGCRSFRKNLKAVSPTFLLVCFLSLKMSHHQTLKHETQNTFY